jgi:hypothetical protein
VSSGHGSSLRGRAVRTQLIGLHRTLGYITRLLYREDICPYPVSSWPVLPVRKHLL